MLSYFSRVAQRQIVRQVIDRDDLELVAASDQIAEGQPVRYARNH